MLLLIDNYDSFTYNLYQYLRELGSQVDVYRNDALTLSDIEKLSPSHLIISPGPGKPKEAGISLAAINHFAYKIPILGVCLGHQALGQAFGAQVVQAQQIMHGKTSRIRHCNQGVFHGLKETLVVARYHSLVLQQHTLPAIFQVTAWSEPVSGHKEIMGIKHRTLPLEGVQFHPESIMSEQGHQLLQNFLTV